MYEPNPGQAWNVHPSSLDSNVKLALAPPRHHDVVGSERTVDGVVPRIFIRPAAFGDHLEHQLELRRAFESAERDLADVLDPGRRKARIGVEADLPGQSVERTQRRLGAARQAAEHDPRVVEVDLGVVEVLEAEGDIVLAGQRDDRRESALTPAVTVSEAPRPTQLVRFILEGADPKRARGAEPRRGGRIAVSVPDRFGDAAAVWLRLLGHIGGVPAHERIAPLRIVPVPDVSQDGKSVGADVAVADRVRSRPASAPSARDRPLMPRRGIVEIEMEDFSGALRGNGSGRSGERQGDDQDSLHSGLPQVVDEARIGNGPASFAFRRSPCSLAWRLAEPTW